jgi:hypothetical protein
VLSGVPGIGKTALWEAGLGTGAAHGYQALRFGREVEPSRLVEQSLEGAEILLVASTGPEDPVFGPPEKVGI